MKSRHGYVIYLGLSGATSLFNAMMFTFLGVYYVSKVGLNPLELVLVGTLLEVTEFIFEIPTGVLADTFSRRLSVIVGTFLVGAAFVLIGSVPLYSIVLVGQVISGVGFTFLSGAREAWIANEVGEENVGQVYLRAAQVRQVAKLVGVFLATGLATIRLDLPITVGGGLTVALAAFLVLAMPERNFRPSPRGERSSWYTLGSTLRDGARVVRGSPVLMLLVGSELFIGAESEGIDRLGQAHFLVNFTFPGVLAFAPVVWFGFIEAGSQILGVAVTEVVRRWPTTTKSTVTARLLFVTQLSSIVGLVVFGLAGNFPLALVAYWVVGAARSAGEPLYTAWMIRLIDPRVRATVLSLSSVSNAVGQAGGGPIIGGIGTAFSLRVAMIAAGLILIPVLPLVGWAGRERRSATSPKGSIDAP